MRVILHVQFPTIKANRLITARGAHIHAYERVEIAARTLEEPVDGCRHAQ
jgi:hypothetical protein